MAALSVVIEGALEQLGGAIVVAGPAVLDGRLVQHPVVVGLHPQGVVIGLGRLAVPAHLGQDVPAHGRQEEATPYARRDAA